MGEQLRVSGNSGPQKWPFFAIFWHFLAFFPIFGDFSPKPREAGTRPPHLQLINDKWISGNPGFPDFPDFSEKSRKFAKNGEKNIGFWKKTVLGAEKVPKNRIFIKPFKK